MTNPRRADAAPATRDDSDVIDSMGRQLEQDVRWRPFGSAHPSLSPFERDGSTGVGTTAGDSAFALARFRDPESGVVFEVHHPATSPERWRAYLDGAEARYRQHDVLAALDRAELADGGSTSLFFVAVGDDNRVVAGIRCHGPHRSASAASAVTELGSHRRIDSIERSIAEWVPEGLVEIKGAWVGTDVRHPGLSDGLARCHVHAMEWFGARFAMCTSDLRTSRRWETAGGRALPGYEPVPYPDDRYHTVLLRWDRETAPGLSDPAQWRRIGTERAQIRDSRVPREDVGPWLPGPDRRPQLLDPRTTGDRADLARILADPTIAVVDTVSEQRATLSDRSGDEVPADHHQTRWAYYPWRRTAVRLLGPDAFRMVRLDRNRNKITRLEQQRLHRLRVGVVGLSVGHSIAYALAQEGVCRELRLADFDRIELSNLNRIPSTVLDLGLPKTTVLSRRIAELDPYLEVTLLAEGVTATNVDRFVDGLDVVVEECDSLDLKLLVRESARRHGVPVLMETSDRGLLDVERFDLEPDRPLFHGLLGDVRAANLVGLSTHDKVPYVLQILEPAELSSRMAASMAEIDQTLATWPQLAGDISLGAASIAAAVRRLGRGEPLPSGRVRIDLDAALDSVADPEPPAPAVAAVPTRPEPPEDALLAVAHAAQLAPSGGNGQPWRLRLDSDRLWVGMDPVAHSTMDVHRRGTYVAIGAAVHNARVAAAARSVLGPVEYFPPGRPGTVAAIRFGTDSDPELAADYRGVLERSTNRRPGTPGPIAPAVAAALHAAVDGGVATLRLHTGADVLADYAELIGESDRLRHLSPALHRELMSELRWPGHDALDRGIDVRTLELDESDLSKLAVARRADVMQALASWDGGRALGDVTRQRLRSSSALAVLTVPAPTPELYVAGGQDLQRLWLAAEKAGLAVHPVSLVSVYAVDEADVAELVPPAYRLRLRELDRRFRSLAGLAAGEAVVLVLRLSHAEPVTVRSLRVALASALLPAAEAGGEDDPPVAR